MTDDGRDTRRDDAADPTELPEHLFRQGEDWKFLKAARRERRRQEFEDRLAALASRDNRMVVLAIAAPVFVLAIAWLLGAVRW